MKDHIQLYLQLTYGERYEDLIDHRIYSHNLSGEGGGGWNPSPGFSFC